MRNIIDGYTDFFFADMPADFFTNIENNGIM